MYAMCLHLTTHPELLDSYSFFFLLATFLKNMAFIQRNFKSLSSPLLNGLWNGLQVLFPQLFEFVLCSFTQLSDTAFNEAQCCFEVRNACFHFFIYCRDDGCADCCAGSGYWLYCTWVLI